MSRISVLALLLLVPAALVGCGGEDPDATSTSTQAAADDGGSDDASKIMAPGGNTVDLQITYLAEPGAEPVAYVVQCNGPEASPDVPVESRDVAAQVCPALATDDSVLTVDPDPQEACTMIAGGPETATVEGVVQGDIGVTRTFDRMGGCNIDRWDQLFAGTLGADSSQQDMSMLAGDGPTVDLKIVYTATKGAEPRTIVVKCDGDKPTDEVPAADAVVATQVCTAMQTDANALMAPVDPNQACTEIYGGDDVAVVTGLVMGDIGIDTTLSRANGCEIDRWDRVFGLALGPGAA